MNSWETKEYCLVMLSVGFNPTEEEVIKRIDIISKLSTKTRMEIIVDYKLEAAKLLYDKIMGE